MLESGLLREGESLYDPSNIRLMHHLNAALRAHAIYKRDVEYIVRNGEVIIVDEFTGRTMPGPPLVRRPAPGGRSEGRREGARGEPDRRVDHLPELLPPLQEAVGHDRHGRHRSAGVHADLRPRSGRDPHAPPDDPQGQRRTSCTSRSPTSSKPSSRTSKIACSASSRCSSAPRPSRLPSCCPACSRKTAFAHEVLNAKQHEREAHIVENAGMPGKVTIATNMAGRGTDIKLGGNNEAELEQAAAAAGEAGLDEVTAARIRADWQARHDKVVAAGGLHIIGTERHESRRIDNQLRGRSGRQGDPGSSRFYLSMEDNLMRIFGDPNRTKRWLAMAGMKEGEVIESGMLTQADREGAAQGRVAQLRRAQAAAHLRRRGQRPAQGHLPAAHRAHGRHRPGRRDPRHPRRGS